MLHGNLMINHHHTILEYEITNEGKSLLDSDCDVYAFRVFGTEKNGRTFSYHWEDEVFRGRDTSAPMLVSILMRRVHDNWMDNG